MTKVTVRAEVTKSVCANINLPANLHWTVSPSAPGRLLRDLSETFAFLVPGWAALHQGIDQTPVVGARAQIRPETQRNCSVQLRNWRASFSSPACFKINPNPFRRTNIREGQTCVWLSAVRDLCFSSSVQAVTPLSASAFIGLIPCFPPPTKAGAGTHQSAWQLQRKTGSQHSLSSSFLFLCEEFPLWRGRRHEAKWAFGRPLVAGGAVTAWKICCFAAAGTLLNLSAVKN